MSAVTNLSSVSPSALPPVNLHSHGHKHGSHVESTDASAESTSNNALGQAPAGSTQNLFGTLMQSLEQVIGLQTTSAAKATAAAAPGTGVTAAASTATAAASTSAATGNTLLQNYLHNAPQNVQAAAAKLRFNA